MADEELVGAKPEPLEIQLSFRMDQLISDLLVELRTAVRRAGHRRPSQKTMVQALIYSAPRDGRELELSVLAPYRMANSSEE